MRFIRTMLFYTVVVAFCAIVLEATGAPVVDLIRWGAGQVAELVAQVEWPAWVDGARGEEMTGPVQAIVNTATEWMAQLAGAE